MRRLLGEAVSLPEELEKDILIAGYASVGASTLGVSERRIEQLEANAAALAKAALASPETRQRLVPCQVAGNLDHACTQQLVTSFGRRAFRRPLSELELARYSTLATIVQSETGDAWSGAEAVVAAMLQSPLFLYRRELGTPASDGRGRRLDAYELGSRLSFFIEGTTPDDALLESAASGALLEPSELRAQAERLLSSTSARESLKVYATETFGLSNLDELPQIPSLFPLLTPTLGASMRTETLMRFESLAFDASADFRELFDSTKTFVNAELARLYGIEEPSGTGFTAVTLPEAGPRRGLLGQAALLAASSHATSASATRRGQFIRERLLCQTIPPPPPSVDTTLPEDAGPTERRTERQKLQAHQENPTCAACHALMDPIGLSLEHFDALGAYRTDDGGLAIDTSGELDGAPFEGLLGLSTLLRERPEVAACTTRNLFRFALGQQELPEQQLLLERLNASFAESGYALRALVLALVQSPEFTRSGELP